MALKVTAHHISVTSSSSRSSLASSSSSTMATGSHRICFPLAEALRVVGIRSLLVGSVVSSGAFPFDANHRFSQRLPHAVFESAHIAMPTNRRAAPARPSSPIAGVLMDGTESSFLVVASIPTATPRSSTLSLLLRALEYWCVSTNSSAIEAATASRGGVGDGAIDVWEGLCSWRGSGRR